MSTTRKPMLGDWIVAKQSRFVSRVRLETMNQPGVFETFRIHRGEGMWLEDHLCRLDESARSLGMAAVDRSELYHRIRREIARRGIKAGAGRVALWRLTDRGGVESALWLRAWAKNGAPAPRPIRLETARIRSATAREVNSGIKANHYLMAIAEEVSRSGADGGTASLFVSPEGWVTESAVANLFAVRNGVLWTPHPSCGILEGITRRWILAAAQSLGWECVETRFTRHELYQSDEVFLTSSLSVAIPVASVDGRRIGAGRGGREWKKIRDRYFELWEKYDGRRT